jgi:hypothetical protein
MTILSQTVSLDLERKLSCILQNKRPLQLMHNQQLQTESKDPQVLILTKVLQKADRSGPSRSINASRRLPDPFEWIDRSVHRWLRAGIWIRRGIAWVVLESGLWIELSRTVRDFWGLQTWKICLNGFESGLLLLPDPTKVDFLSKIDNVYFKIA